MQDLIDKLISVKQCMKDEGNWEFYEMISDLQYVEDSLKTFVDFDNSPINHDCEETKELLRKLHDFFCWGNTEVKRAKQKATTLQQLKQAAKILNLI